METLKLEPEHKLTIEYLSPYLPYELLCTANDVCFTEHPLAALHATNELAIFDFEDGEQDFYLKDFKPLLLPLSELTDGQWIEVFQAGFNAGGSVIKLGKEKISIYKIDIGILIHFFTINEGFIYNETMQNFNVNAWSFNQRSAFRKLYELHADLDGLIDKGLAISKV